MITRNQLYVGRPVKYKGDSDNYQGFIVRIELPLFWCDRSKDSHYGHCRFNIDLTSDRANRVNDYPPSWVTPMILKTSLIKE